MIAIIADIVKRQVRLKKGDRMLKQIVIFHIRGGGILHNMLKYVLFPLILAIGPAILVNSAVIRSDISQPFTLFIAVLVLLFISALFFQIVVRVWVSISLRKDGMLSARVIEPGGAFKSISLRTDEVTNASLSPRAGAPFYLYKKNTVLASWNAQTIGTVNMNAFLRALSEVNPSIEFDPYTKAFVEEGGFTDIERGLFRATLPLILFTLLVFYVPTGELLIYEHMAGEFNWMQEVLQDLFYFTLSPFLGVGLVIFLAKIIERKTTEESNRRQVLHIVSAGLIVMLSMLGGVNHILNFQDFLGRPQALYEQQTKGVRIVWRGEKEGAVTFGLLNVPDLTWTVYVPIEKVSEVERALYDPVTIVYTEHLKTLIKVEKTYSHTLIYKKEKEAITFPSFLKFGKDT